MQSSRRDELAIERDEDEDEAREGVWVIGKR
jgi:hypothetical protein